MEQNVVTENNNVRYFTNCLIERKCSPSSRSDCCSWKKQKKKKKLLEFSSMVAMVLRILLNHEQDEHGDKAEE